MKRSHEWIQNRLGRSSHDGSGDEDSRLVGDDKGQAEAAGTHDSTGPNYKQAERSSEIIYIGSSSGESERLSDSSAQEAGKPSKFLPAEPKKKAKPRERQQHKKAVATSQVPKRRKSAAPPMFTADSTDPFRASSTSVELVVRGKPRPQYRDKPGWNWTRYNPSKNLQKQFCQVAVEQCLNHMKAVPSFGSDAEIKMSIHFRFPLPKTGLIKNTADIDNLSKFILDACNKTFYGDDGQVVSLFADKGYDNAHGGKGYTRMTIQVNSR